MNETASALELDGLKRSFRQGAAEIAVLNGASLAVRPGEIVALLGPSGSGKSTLLQIAGLLERPDAGDVIIAGRGCGRLGDQERTALRRSHIGFVYQFHHLLPEFSALENIVLPQLVADRKKSAARERGRELLAMVGLADRAGHRPAELSGGEQQRVAIVRALANSPNILLADEPTGNLDEQTAGHVFEQLREVVSNARVAALIATHNVELARRMDRCVRLHEGRLHDA